MAKPDHFELPDGTSISILHEDRASMAIDKPPGWMLGPDDWEHADRNLHLALVDLLRERPFWVRSRNLRFLRHVHRLDAGTSGILLLSKSLGAIQSYSKLFASREVSKTYLAVTTGVPTRDEWICRDPLGPVPGDPGRHRVDLKEGKLAETEFRVLSRREGRAVIEARPHTGRTHQIRLHLLAAGCPVVGDDLYGRADTAPSGVGQKLGLRAVGLSYRDPFLGRPVRITAAAGHFLNRFGFSEEASGKSPPALAPTAVRPLSSVETGRTALFRSWAPQSRARKPSSSSPTAH
ncbi:MAG: RluA family pseudouridine synthase [Pedosphaera sp.]|nr:RluA family pseudouridine synthase [Pedosphaera sp.]